MNWAQNEIVLAEDWHDVMVLATADHGICPCQLPGWVLGGCEGHLIEAPAKLKWEASFLGANSLNHLLGWSF